MIEGLGTLEGALSYIHHVKRIAEELRNDNKPVSASVVPGHKTYKKFLFYKYFMALNHPLILTEGRTDNIYLKYAIRHLADTYPQLGQLSEGTFTPSVRFFSYDNKEAHRILELTGGAGPLHGFVNTFRANLQKYRHRPLSHPVMVLIDNDTALTSKFKSDLKRNYHIDINQTSAEAFYHLTDNLYLIKTPEIGPSGVSCIEDFFEDTVKSTPLEGKSFTTAKTLDPETQYGKVRFAENVIIPMAEQIVWDGFRPLLNRIVAVITHYVPPASAILVEAA